jgi:hypothetical protein
LILTVQDQPKYTDRNTIMVLASGMMMAEPVPFISLKPPTGPIQVVIKICRNN